MRIERVDHVDLIVRDIDRSVQFYKKLGMVVQGTLDNGQTVFLWNQDEEAPLVVELHQEGSPLIGADQKAGLGHVAFQVEDVESAYNELVEAGVSFSLKPRYGSLSGRTVALTHDPDGTPIQLARKVTRGEYEDFK